MKTNYIDILDKYLKSIYTKEDTKNQIEIRALQRYINLIERKARAYDEIKETYADFNPDYKIIYK